MAMNIVCLDLEGVLVPEIWIAFAEAVGIPELKITNREEPDYDKLLFVSKSLNSNNVLAPSCKKIFNYIEQDAEIHGLKVLKS